MSWIFHGDFFEISLKSHGIRMEISWNSHGNLLLVSWYFLRAFLTLSRPIETSSTLLISIASQSCNFMLVILEPEPEFFWCSCMGFILLIFYGYQQQLSLLILLQKKSRLLGDLKNLFTQVFHVEPMLWIHKQVHILCGSCGGTSMINIYIIMESVCVRACVCACVTDFICRF